MQVLDIQCVYLVAITCHDKVNPVVFAGKHPLTVYIYLKEGATRQFKTPTNPIYAK